VDGALKVTVCGLQRNAVLDAYQNYAAVDFSARPPGSKSRFSLPSIGDPSLLADTVAPLLSTSIEQKQQILETTDVVTRHKKLIELMRTGHPEAVASTLSLLPQVRDFRVRQQ
jgi:ATP-dependent Lon protease